MAARRSKPYSAQPRLAMVKFPVDDPDLNPQEQVWKQAQRAVSHNHLLPKLPPLADEFEQYLKTTTFQTSFLDCYGDIILFVRFWIDLSIS